MMTENKNIDANILAKSMCGLLKKQGVIPNKPCNELSGSEIKEITDKLFANADMNKEIFNNAVEKTDRERALFMLLVCCNTIAYINRLDLNKFFAFKAK